MTCEHQTGPWPVGQKWPACLKCEIEKLTKERDKFRKLLLICSTEGEKQARQELSLAEEGLANYAQEVERLRTALEGIKAFPVGAFRSLEDECAIWRIANEALNGVPQAGEQASQA